MDRFSVSSSDGAQISVAKSGAGPALLLVHGAMLNAVLAWAAVLRTLSEHHTVYAMDRRGRAPSTDGPDYSIALEAEDISRVVEAIAQPVTLVAHSYGALSTIEALLTVDPQRLKTIERVILYEPPGIVAGSESRAGAAAKMQQALEANNPEEIVRGFLLDQIGAPPEIFPALQASPAWPIVLRIAPTLPREARSVNAYHQSAGRPGSWKVSTVLLLGSETTGPMKEGVMLLSRILPDCRLVVIEGQGHSAMLHAPGLFVDTLLGVLSGPEA
jgi:pimeloyl-ACP methyl ester carboxylesterase